jgi:glycerate kinase
MLARVARPARRVLVAFDKFKGALSAAEACTVAARVLARERPEWQLDIAPLSDGGDGFAAIVTEARGGSRTTHAVHGPRFESAPAATVSAGLAQGPIGWLPIAHLPSPVRALLELPEGAPSARVAVLDMASVNGLAQLPLRDRDPWRTTSYGTGELLRHAAREEPAALLLGLGGSATSDLGLGALAALGLEFLDARGEAVVPPLPERWSRIERIRGAVRPPLPPCLLATDVDNPLLGARGAAAVYGPQKGLAAADLPRFEAAAQRMAALLLRHCGAEPAMVDAPGAGAAGGTAFGLMVAAGARVVNGFDVVAACLELRERIERADLVITGEGRFDASSLSGKGPGALRARAAELGREAVVFAGRIGRDLGPARSAGQAVIAISPPRLPLARALPETAARLERAIERWLALEHGREGAAVARRGRRRSE